MTASDVFIIGAGPAGLTASFLLTKEGVSTTVIEADPVYVGGISRTANYKDFKFDIGGHRFFSKSKEVVALWDEILPQDFIDRPRLSRIYYNGRYFSYPLKAFEAFTNLGPVEPTRVNDVHLRARSKGVHVTVFGVDRFPRMVDYVIPSGVRIADADRVRLGAHVADGTVVMHEGFINFNAGTLGTSMVEGRISAGVVVGDGSDIGGGASIMGTLSGGGTEVISIGRGCLVGANAGVGSCLGDDCVVDAGCYFTAGSKVLLPDGAVANQIAPPWVSRASSSLPS